jgi:hypothetical protein
MKINPKWQSIDTLSGPARPILITSAGNTTVCHNYNPLKNLNVFHLFKPTHFCEVPPFYLYPIEAEFDCCQKCSEREQKLQDENQALRDQVALLEKQLATQCPTCGHSTDCLPTEETSRLREFCKRL